MLLFVIVDASYSIVCFAENQLHLPCVRIFNEVGEASKIHALEGPTCYDGAPCWNRGKIAANLFPMLRIYSSGYENANK